MSAGKALLVSHHAAIVGGGELSLLTLLQGLRRLQWQPELLVPDDGELARRAAGDGVPVHCEPMPTLRRPGRAVLRALRRMRALVRERRPDVVHANGTRAMFYAGWAARAIGCPTVWHLRIIDDDPFFDRVLVRQADGYIATSEAARARLRRWPRALASCRVIPNGLDLAGFVPGRSRAEVRAELDGGEDDLLVATAGRLVDFKRFDLLLDALARVRGRCPAVRGLVIGDGPERQALQQRAASDDLGGAVRFTGRRDDVADLLAAADIFVLTSPVESFGRVVIEAMAMGLPVIAPAAGGPGEIVIDGETGLLVEPDEVEAFVTALERLCDDADLRHELGAAGRRRVAAEYSLEIHAHRVADFYRDLLAAAGPAEASSS